MLAGARGEGICFQVVLRADEAMDGLIPRLTTMTGPGGKTFPATAVFLYRVGYVTVPQSSDTDPNTGAKAPVTHSLWPDALYPIGPDPCLGSREMARLFI
jgi:hypothetical protein